MKNNDTCDICNGLGYIERWNSYTGKPTGDNMCCWNCGGDGRWLHIGFREKVRSGKINDDIKFMEKCIAEYKDQIEIQKCKKQIEIWNENISFYKEKYDSL